MRSPGWSVFRSTIERLFSRQDQQKSNMQMLNFSVQKLNMEMTVLFGNNDREHGPSCETYSNSWKQNGTFSGVLWYNVDLSVAIRDFNFKALSSSYIDQINQNSKRARAYTCIKQKHKLIYPLQSCAYYT